MKCPRFVASAAALLLLGLAAPAAATVFQYDNTTSGTIPFVSTTVETAPLTECVSPPPGVSPLVRTFVVSDSFTVGSVAVGLNISHALRDEVVAVLESPTGTRAVLLNDTGFDSSDNYDVLLVANAETVGPDDGDADTVAEPFYHRDVPAGGLASFASESAAGTWTLTVCDDTTGTTGTLERARLVLDSASDVLAASVCSSSASYDWGSNGHIQPFVSAAFGDVTLSQVSTTDVFNNSVAGADFETRTSIQGGDTGYYAMAFDAEPGDNPGDGGDESGAMITVFSFDPPVRDLAFSLLDVDFLATGWEDYVKVEAEDASGNLLPYNAAAVDPSFTEQIGDQFEGDSDADTTEDLANVDYVVAGPVSQLRVEYFTGDSPEDPNLQVIGISDPSLCAYDYGDAPDSYSTALAGGARHVLGARSLYLGVVAPDGESDGQPSAAASADGVEEDGVGSFPSADLQPGGTYTVSVTATNQSGVPANLCGWIDFDLDGSPDDGTFESDEGACVVVPAAGGSNASCIEGASGVFACTVAFTVPADFVYVSDEPTFARFRVTTDPLGTGDFAGRADDGEVEDYEVPANTLPVTLASFASQAGRGRLEVRWTTASETVNAGFRLYGRRPGGEWTELASTGSRAVGSRPAEYELALASGGWSELALEDVDFRGRGRWHGPFAVGDLHGSEPEVREIDWSAVRRAAGLSSGGRADGAGIAARDATRGAARPRGPAAAEGRLLVSEAGIQRVTYEQLRLAGIELAGVPAAQIAIRDRGAGVPRYVGGGGVFGPGSFLEWVAEPALTLASPVDVFEVAVDPARAVPAVAGRRAPASAPPASHPAELVVDPDHAYGLASPIDDPWFDGSLYAQGGPVTAERDFDLPGLLAGPAELTVELWGSIDWPGAAPDHHLVVHLNGVELDSVFFDGITPFTGRYDVSGLVLETGNVLELTAPGDTGYGLDLINREGFSVAYTAETRAVEGRWSGHPSAPGSYAVLGMPSGPAVVWVDRGDRVVRQEAVVGGGKRASGTSGELVVPAGGAPAWVASESALRVPEIAAGLPAPAPPADAEYLIVVHPVFAGGIGDLVALQQGRGLSVEVVSVDSIWARGSDHAPDPAALRDFIADSAAGGRLRHVLLVGGDSYDPYDHLGLGSVSFIPTAYARFDELVSWVPSDALLADGDGDAIPDVAIGRLPARTPDELAAMIDKLWAWEQRRPVPFTPRAVLAAGRSDRNRDLAEVNDAFAARLSSSAPPSVIGSGPIGLAAVDDVGQPEARRRVLQAFDAGIPLISFVGHSSYGLWDFNPLLRWQDVAAMRNVGSPSLVTQWGCWNSYFVSPEVETLSDHLLVTPEVGAAGTIGSTTLTSASVHRVFGDRFFRTLAGGAETVGKALLTTQRELAAEGRPEEAVLGMILLGDPAMPLQ